MADRQPLEDVPEQVLRLMGRLERTRLVKAMVTGTKERY